MKVIVVKDYDEMSRVGADVIKQVIQSKPNAVLGLATGSTPIGMYGLLIDACNKGEISFAKVQTVNLDEYVGLDVQSNQSYVYFMRDQLFNHVDIDLANTHLPNGKAKDVKAECDSYTKLVASLKQDVQVLGLGSNGHIGFNEPNTPFDSHTHVVDLTENTIKDNSRLFDRIEDVPRQALTMGIADILQSRKILMLASGANKAKAVYGMVKGEVSPSCPASALQLHDDVIIVVDESAASLL